MNHQAPGGDRADLEGRVEHRAPGDPGRVTEAEEAQGGLGEDRDRHGQGGVGEDHRHHVGQHVPADLVGRAGAEDPGALEVGPLPDRDRLAPDQQRGPGPRGHPDHDDDVEQRAPQHRREHDRQGQERDHQEPLGHPEQQRAGPAREEARRQPDQGADHHRDQGGGEPDEQRDPGAPDEQREHRPALVVGAQPVLRRRRLEHPTGRLRHLESLLGGDHRRQDRDQEEERRGCRARPCRSGGCGSCATPRRRALATSTARQRLGRQVGRGRVVVGAHVRTLGSRSP